MAAILRSDSTPLERWSRFSSARAVLVLFIFVATVLGFSRARADIIKLSESDVLGDCVRIDTPGQTTIYVLHSITGGATGCRFRIQAGPGMTMTYVSETHDFPMTIGDTQTGMTVCYNTCLPGPLYRMAAITYMAYGTSACAELRIVPHPGSESVEERDCNFQTNGGVLVQNLKVATNPDCLTCPPVFSYPGPGIPFDCSPLPVEESTWGRIKALYR